MDESVRPPKDWGLLTAAYHDHIGEHAPVQIHVYIFKHAHTTHTHTHHKYAPVLIDLQMQ